MSDNNNTAGLTASEPFSVRIPIAESQESCSLQTLDANTVQRIWFKTTPVDRSFCRRVAQLQLCTDSYDQGWADNPGAGSWSWFEVCILANSEATQPKVQGNKTLSWTSHHNRVGVGRTSRYFGVVFDLHSPLLNSLEVRGSIAKYLHHSHLGHHHDLAW